MLVSGSEDKSIILWELDTEKLKILNVHCNTVRCLIHLNDDLIASGGDDCTIYIWNIRGWKAIKKLESHSKGIYALEKIETFLNGILIVSGSNDNTIRIWNSEEGKLLKKCSLYTSSTNSLLNVGNNQIVSGGNDKIIRNWEIEKGDIISDMKGSNSGIFSLVFIPGNEKILVSGSSCGEITFWNLKNGKEIFSLVHDTMTVTSLICVRK